MPLTATRMLFLIYCICHVLACVLLLSNSEKNISLSSFELTSFDKSKFAFSVCFKLCKYKMFDPNYIK